MPLLFKLYPAHNLNVVSMPKFRASLSFSIIWYHPKNFGIFYQILLVAQLALPFLTQSRLQLSCHVIGFLQIVPPLVQPHPFITQCWPSRGNDIFPWAGSLTRWMLFTSFGPEGTADLSFIKAMSCRHNSMTDVHYGQFCTKLLTSWIIFRMNDDFLKLNVPVFPFVDVQYVAKEVADIVGNTVKNAVLVIKMKLRDGWGNNVLPYITYRNVKQW